MFTIRIFDDIIYFRLTIYNLYVKISISDYHSAILQILYLLLYYLVIRSHKIMPIRIPDGLPAADILSKENIFVMSDFKAEHQDIRPLRIAILNIMPTKVREETETQLIRVLSNTPLQVETVLLYTASHRSENNSADHLSAFYKSFDQVKNEKFDGLIITGAPVENMPFEKVDYWDELCEIMNWSKINVYSTLHICWGAQAGLYFHYGINKYPIEKKI